MNENLNEIYTEEKSISIVDMLFYILYRWKIVFAVAMAVAVAVVSLSFVKNSTENNEPMMDLMHQAELTEEEASDLRYKVNLINSYEKMIAECDEYLQKSIKMQLDSTGYYEGNLCYVLSGENSADILTVALKCKGKMESEETFENLSKSLNEKIQSSMLREVVTVSLRTSQEEEQAVLKMTNEQVLDITVLHYNRSECVKILNYLEDILDEEVSILLHSIPSVKVENVAYTVALKSDSQLINDRKEFLSVKFSAYEDILNTKEKMSENQKQYYELMYREQAEGEMFQTEDSRTDTRINWKYVIVIAVAAAFCVMAFFAAVYLFSGSIHTKRELESCIGIPVIGYDPGNWKKKRNPIDQLINKLEIKAGGVYGDTLEMVCAVLKRYAEQENTKKFYVSGSCMAQGTAVAALEQLKKMLEADGIEFLVGQNILEDAMMFQDAIECGNIVFWEKCNQSLEQNIRAEINKVISCNAKVLAIVLER